MTRTQPAQTASSVRAVQAAAVLSVLALLWQFATAGRILAGSAATDAHGAGAIALHVTTGLLVVATLLHARAGGTRWPVVVAALVFVATFVQAALGDAGKMSAHVPGAFVIVVGTVWVTAWAFRGRTTA
jgi:uncharacterized membrane protein